MRTTIGAAAITAAVSTAMLTGCGHSAADHTAQVKACTVAMTALIKQEFNSNSTNVPEIPAACKSLPDQEIADITNKVTQQLVSGSGASVSTSLSPSP